ncbi:MAG: PD40 domain-containing protein, partial [Luteimonas sp.]|nr:PD40 domain-containing protein [Luteimonas sp.]
MKLLPLCLLLAAAPSVQTAHAEVPRALPNVVEINVPADTARGRRPRQPAGQELPLQPSRSIAFETDEGTWMSVDRSAADGRIVFDLLGDLYTLDPAGGRATPITRGMAMDTQPTFSPDGQWIAFVSDRSGADNLWIARADGSDARQVSFGADDTVLVSPAWSADGSALYVSRFLWSVNDYELWRYALDGTETLVVPAKSESGGEQSSLGAVESPDGRFLYLARRTGSEDAAGTPSWSIVRRDLADGSERTLLPEPGVPGRRPYAGTFFRPALSPDGRLLAYATRHGGQTGLRLRDLGTGDDRWLALPIEADQLHAQSWQDLVPRYAFSRDGKALLLSRNGGLERLPIDGGRATPIPFVAPVELALGPLTRQDIRQDTGPVRARLVQAPMPSPDGKRLAFSALGGLYVMPLDGAAPPRRLDVGDAPAFHPAWSPDGRHLAYVTWTAREGGHVWTVPADGGTPRRLGARAAFYTYPAFAPDGTCVWVVSSGHEARNQAVVNYGQLRAAELLELPVDGGTERVVYRGTIGGRVHLGPGGRVQVRGEEGLLGIDPATGDAEAPIVVKGPGWYFQDGSTAVDDLRLSPDGRWLLAQVAQQLHLLPAPPPGQSVDLSRPGVAHRRITDVGADFFEWADGGDSIVWAIGSTFHRRRLDSIALHPAGRPGWDADPPTAANTETFNAIVEVPRDTPVGTLLLRGARAITLRGDEVIEHADVLVRDGRIAAVGRRGDIDVPADAEILDVSGKTLVPGFIDMHDHVSDIRRDVLQMDSWGLAARLAYGITTAFDPSTLSIDYLAYQDLVDAGLVL